MDILIVSTASTPCNYILIQSIGESTYDGWYERFIFGTYRFLWIDERDNYIYFANIEGYDRVIFKDMENDWVVCIVLL